MNEAARQYGAQRPILVRTYQGRSQSDAARLFAQDAPALANEGYFPISQSWADGRAGVGRVLMLGILANTMRPDGTLTVTYQFKAAVEPARAALEDVKICPRCAETVKAAAIMCRFCQYDFPKRSAPLSDSVKICPDCAEEVVFDAVRCPYCEHDFSGSLGNDWQAALGLPPTDQSGHE